MIEATLVAGSSGALRETRIASALASERRGAGTSASPAAVLLEGLPGGQDASPLDAMAKQQPLWLVRTAPGCFCCTGRLPLQVHLNRLLRQGPSRLFIGIADGRHLPSLRELLARPPYDAWLRLTADLTD